jgi:hypothetical protein
MLQEILQWMNVKIEKRKVSNNDENATDKHDVNITELRDFIGLLFYTAVFQSNHENIRPLFATNGTG